MTNQKQFEKLLQAYDRADGYARTQLKKDIFAARDKEDRIFIWKDQSSRLHTVGMAIVQFYDDKKIVKRENITSADDTCFRMTRFSFRKDAITPLADKYSGQYVSPRHMVAAFEGVNYYNLIEVTDNPDVQAYVQTGKYKGFDFLWNIVNAPRTFVIVHTEVLVDHFYVEGQTTVEEALDEFQHRAGEGEYDFGDMEMVESVDIPVPEGEESTYSGGYMYVEG